LSAPEPTEVKCCVCGKTCSGLDPEEWHGDPPPLCSAACRKQRRLILKGHWSTLLEETC
jgi:hypothetical protein